MVSKVEKVEIVDNEMQRCQPKVWDAFQEELVQAQRQVQRLRATEKVINAMKRHVSPETIQQLRDKAARNVRRYH